MNDAILRLITAGDPRPAIRAMLGSAPYTVLTNRCFRDLVHHAGGHDQAMRWLLAVANDAGKPIGLNIQEEGGPSQTIWVAPRRGSERRG